MLNRIAVLAFFTYAASIGNWVSAAEPRVVASLVSDCGTIVAGDTFRVGILFKIPERAHIYWLNPGESGLPTAIEWALPDGFEVGDLQWPAPLPIRDEVLDETSFGYEREVLLFSEVRAPTTLLPGATFRVDAKPSWLVCLEDGLCIPEYATLNVEIKVADASVVGGFAAIFDVYAPRTPRAASEFSGLLTVTTSGGQLAVRVLPNMRWGLEAATCVFFPDEGGPWKASAANGNDVRSAEFSPAAPIDGNPAGTLYLDLKNAESSERRSVYVRVGG